jgi:glycosyltransferase involved in cell wall biosynthesis
MHKVLIVTYYWPPGSGAGVQRWLKFSKYLPSYGWEPVVLTVDPGYASYPAIDYTLENDIPEIVRVYKTKSSNYFRVYGKDKSGIISSGFANSDNSGFRSKILRFIRGNFFIPDPRRGWNKFAFRKACELIENERISHIVTTSPPHSTQLIGLKLKKKYPSIKWLADLRDPWTDIYYYSMFYHTWPAKLYDSKLEKQVLSGADRIITVGRSLKKDFSVKAGKTGDKIKIIPNGYDEDDFTLTMKVQPVHFTISYVGTLSEAYPVEGLLKAITNLRKTGTVIKLLFAGSVSPGRKELILSYMSPEDVQFINYVDHATAIKYMLSGSALLLIIPVHKSSRSIITGKLFEYIATGNPVICLGPPDGDAAEILSGAAAGNTFDYNDIIAITEFLGDLAAGKFSAPRTENIKDYSRQSLTLELANILNEI